MNIELRAYIIVFISWTIFYFLKSDSGNQVRPLVWWEIPVIFLSCMGKANAPFNLMLCFFNYQATLLHLGIQEIDVVAILRFTGWCFVNFIYCGYIYFALMVASNHVSKLTIFEKWRVLLFLAIVIDWLGYVFIRAIETEQIIGRVVISFSISIVEIVLLAILFHKYKSVKKENE